MKAKIIKFTDPTKEIKKEKREKQAKRKADAEQKKLFKLENYELVSGLK